MLFVFCCFMVSKSSLCFPIRPGPCLPGGASGSKHDGASALGAPKCRPNFKFYSNFSFKLLKNKGCRCTLSDLRVAASAPATKVKQTNNFYFNCLGLQLTKSKVRGVDEHHYQLKNYLYISLLTLLKTIGNATDSMLI